MPVSLFCSVGGCLFGIVGFSMFSNSWNFGPLLIALGVLFLGQIAGFLTALVSLATFRKPVFLSVISLLVPFPGLAIGFSLVG